MTETDMRLRLVVRRNGLPEARLMWNVRLENEPTVSKLLEQLNEDVPLESDDWGLEDYVVELHDDDGTSFECLHYQPIRNVLKPDDRVFIRALERDDTRRRRISGRYQISTDGKHLVDGVPFGRPRLKAPTGRPPIYIPPRKRARLTYDHEDGGSDGSPSLEDDTSMLLLTNGEAQQDECGSSSVKVGAEFDDADAGDDEFDGNVQHDGTSDDSESDEYMHEDEDDSDLPSEEDIGEELRGLIEENAALEEGVEPRDQPHQEPRAQLREGPREQREKPAPNMDAANKISALQAAFPSAPVEICETILTASDGDLKATYGLLADGFAPALPSARVLAWPQVGNMDASRQNPPEKAISAQGSVAGTDKPISEDIDGQEESEEDQSEDDAPEEVSALVRKYDYRGLPPGSITSGKGLTQMAAISGSFTSSKLSRDSEATSTTLAGSKISPKKPVEEEDSDTSSSGTSSSSEEDSPDDKSKTGSSDEGTDSDSSEDDESGDGGPSGAPAASSERKSDDDSSNDDSSDESDSGPDELSARETTSKLRGSGGSKHGAEAPDCPNESQRSRGNSNNEEDETSSDGTSDDSSDSSDDESSEAGSSSGSESEVAHSKAAQGRTTTSSSQNPAAHDTLSQPVSQGILSQEPTEHSPQRATVPPGAGKESTKSRNARRRTAQKAKRLAQQQAGGGDSAAVDTSDRKSASPSTVSDAERALFEAKRRELLDAIANGGIEVGSQNPIAPADDSMASETGSKRKRDEPESSYVDEQTPADQEIHKTMPASESSQTPTSAQKRRRIDLGAGRRLVFGALGLRNPKTKEDEDKLRNKLMKDVQPLPNPRLEQDNPDPEQDGKDQELLEEDIDSWKPKVIYRAVECCHEGVELSEPPFPFKQRWDPQQKPSRGSKKNKGGGRGKRAQRNQAQYYQDDSLLGEKRKHDESVEWDEEGYDVTFNGIEDNGANADVTLNYDDDEPQDQEMVDPTAEVSQFTDDDLPSLPEDLSTLPALHPGEAQDGMVITWKKWSMSSATSWQPQVSSVTGVVVHVEDDVAGLKVLLARRDRHLDENQKRYDPSTGQRIYDKFEAPDLEENSEDGGDGGDNEEHDEEAEGYRTMQWADMQEPRILQQPIPLAGDGEPVEEQPANAGDSIPGVNTSSESDHIQAVQFEAADQLERPPSQDKVEEDMSLHVDQTTLVVSAESISLFPQEPPEGPISEATSNSTSHQPRQVQQVADLSISDTSQVSSPSRQLHETASQAISAASQGQPGLGGSISENTSQGMADDGPDVSRSAPISARESSAPILFDGDETNVITGTPKVVRHRRMVPSSASSTRSGRQPDYTMDIDHTEPDSLKVTEDEAYGVSAILGEESQAAVESEDDGPTPTPTPAPQTGSPAIRERMDKDIDAPSPRADPLSPGSLSSLNTVWCTAVTPRNTQIPSKSQNLLSTKKPEKSQALRDQEYEEAMRKLDESSGEEHDSASKITDSYPPKSQNMTGLDAAFEDEDEPIIKESSLLPHPRSVAKISPPPRKRRSPRQRSQFTLPPGTQVLELSSDSEPAFTENYADDEVDETYSPKPESLPKRSGWLKREGDAGHRATRNSTAPSFPQGMAKRNMSASQGHKSISPSSSLSGLGNGKTRRRASARP